MHVLPKVVQEIPEDIPLFFIAGPTTGADDWQLRAYRMLEAHYGPEGFVAAMPCRYGSDHALKTELLTSTYLWTAPRQQPWEIHYLELAGFPPHCEGHPRGCVIMWIPEQTMPRPKKQGEYARNSKREGAKFAAFLQWEPDIRFVMGAPKEVVEDEDFGLDHITRDFDHALEKNGTGGPFPVYPTLEATVAAAIKLAA